MRKIVFLLFAVVLFSACSKEENGTVVDWEGNVYKTKNYGGTWWMVENMRTTRTKDGQNIWVSSDEDKHSYTTPYCYFIDDNEKISNKRGCLYNWPAANQVCPDGWHLPTPSDVEHLVNYLGGIDKYCYDGNHTFIAWAMATKDGWASSGIVGTPGYLPEVPFMGQAEYNTGNNASGFSAYPVGFYSPYYDTYFAGRTLRASYWMDDDLGVNRANSFNVWYDSYIVENDTVSKSVGFTIRCVKNQ